MIICDRCGEKTNEKEINDELYEIRKLAERGSPFMFAKKNAHLCPKCMKSFDRWWKHGRIAKLATFLIEEQNVSSEKRKEKVYGRKSDN